MQVEEVASFVANNARRVLGVEAARVLPVSARSALDAKLAATKEKRGFSGELTMLPCRTKSQLKHTLTAYKLPIESCHVLPT